MRDYPTNHSIKLRKIDLLGSHRKRKRANVNLFRKRKKRTPARGLSEFFIVFTGIIFLCIFAGAIYIGFYLQTLEKSLPDPDKLVGRKSAETTIITDRNGVELYKIYADQNRKFVKLEDLPEHFKWAVLSAEDSDFYDHGGFDLEAIVKSAYINLISREIVRGASTITQQLVRNTIMYDVFGEEAFEETYTRKIKEILLTIQVEKTLTKDEILQMYVNEVGFGGVNYGVQAASIAYFGKDAKDLTLAESAMLAGSIASPSSFSPVYSESFELPTRRQHAVLDSILENHEMTNITEEEIEEAKKQKLKYSPMITRIEAPHFVFHVKRELEEMYGAELVHKGGLQVKTTLDLDTQKIAEDEIMKGIERYGHRWGVRNGAMVVIDPHTNEVLSMVGSVNYWETEDPRIQGNVNVTTRLRQMGSSVKPYTYLSAFERGYSPSSIVPDKKEVRFPNYTVRNWDGKYFGDITARQALLQSRNIPAVYLTQRIGVGTFIDTAEKMGITTLTDINNYGLSITLGAAEMTLLEHTAAYSVFVNEGAFKPTASILEVKDSDDQVIYQHQNHNEQIFDKKNIRQINWILCDLGGYGDQPQNHHYFINGRRVLCGKTGTSDGPRDLTAMMYHKNLVVGVWAGNNNNVTTPGAWSTTVSLPISHSFIQRVSDKYPPQSF